MRRSSRHSSPHAGLLKGLEESAAGDIRKLLELAKLVVLAGLHERLRYANLSRDEDPLSLALYLAMSSRPWLAPEAKQAEDRLGALLEELLEIGRHPLPFIETVGQSAWRGAAADWSHLKDYAGGPKVRHNFEAGRLLGRALHQAIASLMPVVGSGAGRGVKLGAQCPGLLRLARLINRGGRLEELEEAEKLGQGARTADAEVERVASSKAADAAPSKQPSYVHGASDGGPGQWGKPTTPRNALGAEYQRLVTGAPGGTEYKVPLPSSKSGFVDFDGYDPQRKVLLDAKDYNNWPSKKPEFLRKKAIKDILESARIQSNAVRATGTPIEWHVPTEAKADELRGILLDNEFEQIQVVVTPKP